MATTLFASGPFVPSTASNCTCAPSASDLKPSPAIDEWWTNTSFPPSAGVMNPYPFASLNHFTVPVAIQTPPPPRKNGQRKRTPRNRYSLVSAVNRSTTVAPPRPAQVAEWRSSGSEHPTRTSTCTIHRVRRSWMNKGSEVVVLDLEELQLSPTASLFEGGPRAGVGVSMFVVRTPPGRAVELHTHPYPETFLLLEGH